MKVSSLFDVFYGTNLELNHLTQTKNGINFVSRTSKNNGVSATVERIDDVEPLDAGLITVAGGGSVMSSFVQNKPFYSGRDMFYLKPKKQMTLQEKIFYCLCLRANKIKYSYGRQANTTLSDIELPDKVPSWVNELIIDKSVTEKPLHKKEIKLTDRKWLPFRYDDERLFKIERGRGARKKDIVKNGKTPFITAIDSNNGLTGMVMFSPTHVGNVISVNRNGNGVAEAFYQSKPFCSTEDVHIFNPQFELNQYRAMFLITLIRKEKYRYNFGRKWGLSRMNETIMKLPVDDDNNPDWQFMEDYIKSLPYSSNLKN